MTPGQHMAAEIDEQPEVIDRILRDGVRAIETVARSIRDRDLRFVLLAARGTSDHAALYAKYLFEIEMGLPAGLVSPSTETVYGARPDLRQVLFIAVSQSGGSPDLVESVAIARACGATTLTVTNSMDSPLARASEHAIDVLAGPEQAVAATKTYVAELLSLWLLVTSLREADHTPALALPDAAHRTLAGAVSAREHACRYRFATGLVTTARGYSYPTAREGALKLMETSSIGAQAFSGADLAHGPMAMVGPETPVIAVVSPGRGGATMPGVLDAVSRRTSEVLVVGTPPAPHSTLPSLPVVHAGIPENLLPTLEIMPLQRLALHLALERGANPDAPHGLHKVTQTW